jgi:hypothetical protein
LASRGKLVGKDVPTTLSYGGDTDAGRSSPFDVKSGSSSASHNKAPSQISQQTYTARDGDNRRSHFDDTWTTPQWLSSNMKDDDRTTENDKNAAIMIRRPLSHVDRETQYLMQYCI